jgi:hypothetical protein
MVTACPERQRTVQAIKKPGRLVPIGLGVVSSLTLVHAVLGPVGAMADARTTTGAGSGKGHSHFNREH